MGLSASLPAPMTWRKDRFHLASFLVDCQQRLWGYLADDIFRLAHSPAIAPAHAFLSVASAAALLILPTILVLAGRVTANSAPAPTSR